MNKNEATKSFDFTPVAKAAIVPNGTLFNIQILRGLAACMVVLYHSSEAWSTLASGTYSRAWFGGASGVDIFFVISGFVMAISSLGKGEGAKAALKFFKRRIIRVMPLYWLITTLLLLQLMVHFLRHGSTLIHISIKDGIFSYLLIPYKLDASPLVGHAWTLSYEMFFYLCLAIAIFTRKNAANILTIILSMLVFLGFFRTNQWPMATVLFSPWLLEFLAGLWLGVAAKNNLKLSTRVSSTLGAAALLILWFAPPLAGGVRRLVWGICAVCVVQAAIAMESRIGKRMPVWALLVGDASYSIYLIHPFLLGILISILSRLHIITAGRLRFEDELATTLFCLICVSIIGIAVHKLVEYPLNRRLTGRERPVQVDASARA